MSRISTTAVGTVNVTTLRDGERTLPPEALKNLSDEDIQKINSDENQSFTFTNFNACVIQNGKQNLLVDTGCGSLFGPTCGFILDALDELGLAPDDITDINRPGIGKVTYHIGYGNLSKHEIPSSDIKNIV